MQVPGAAPGPWETLVRGPCYARGILGRMRLDVLAARLSPRLERIDVASLNAPGT
jgi:hypothetical protein